MNRPTRIARRSWPGHVPHNWEVLRLKWLVVGVESGVSVNATNQSAAAGEPGVLKTSAVSGGLFFPNENKAVWTSETDRVACPVRGDTVIMSRMNTPSLVAESGYVDRSHPDLFLPDRLWQITFDSRRVFTPFIAKVLACSGARSTLSEMATGTSGSMKNLAQEDMLNLQVPLPPILQQRAIADYLDQETARLDGLVAAKESVLGLLAEKRRVLITRGVTRGLNTRALFRDSCIPWLGEIPAHWAATRLKFVAEVQGGLTVGMNYGTAALVEYPYLRVANVQDGYLDLSDVATILIPEAEAESCLLAAGDVLMNEGGDADKLGRGCIWAGEIDPCLHQNHVFAVRPRLVRSEWLNAWTSTEAAKAFFESRAKQSTNLASISATNIKELPIPVPPVDEQSAIVAHISAETAKLDAMRSAMERTIALLREHRVALIAAAVTGRLPIPEAT